MMNKILTAVMMVVLLAVTVAGQSRRADAKILKGVKPPPSVTLTTASAASGNALDALTATDVVTLQAACSAATMNDGSPVAYNWKTTAGQISGNGNSATLNLTGVAAGEYLVSVEVRDKCCNAYEAKRFRVLEPTVAILTCFATRELSVLGDLVYVNGKPAKIKASINSSLSGGSGYGTPRASWTASKGGILSASNTEFDCNINAFPWL